MIGRRLRFAIFQQEVIWIIKDNVPSVQMTHCLFFVFAPANSLPCFRVARLLMVFCFPFVTNSPPETGASTTQWGGGGLYSQSFIFHFYVLIHPLRRYAPRPPVSGGQSAGAVIVSRFPIVTNSPPETGGVPRSGVGGG